MPLTHVLVAATDLAPSYGGPAVSVSRLAAALSRQGLRVSLWSAREPPGSQEFGSEPVDLVVGPLGKLVRKIKPDLIHDNGLWLQHNHRLAAISARSGIPRIVSPRGMLEPWARQHKGAKKTVAWVAYQRDDLRRASLLHATSEKEAGNLRSICADVPVVMVPNGVDFPESIKGSPASHGDRRTALFLGRIYPVKGLPMLLEAWALVRPSGWRLHIAGPDEGGHQAQLEQLVETLGLGEVVSFIGPVSGPAKTNALAAADLLVLPSHSESFGMVVAEALAHGRPVLATTAVPWPQLESLGCGWRTPPTVSGLADGLRRALSCDASALRAMGSCGRELVATQYGWEGVATRFLTIYEQAAAAARH